MKRKVIIWVCCVVATLLLPVSLIAQAFSYQGAVSGGKVLEGLRMESQSGNSKIDYAIYLPPCYEDSKRSYPVLYLLHGYSDNETAWIQFGEVHLTADHAIAAREIPPMIIVMPDAGVSWYINAYDGSNNFEDLFIKEFIPYIDNTYRTRDHREFRGVSGLSMGGYGSLIYALKHPEVFSVCAAFSAAVFTDSEITDMSDEGYERFFKRIYGSGQANERLTSHWQSHSVINLINTLPQEQVRRVKYYIDNGDDDFLFEGNAMLHIAMRKREIPHEFRVRDGAHNWTYWRTHIFEGLKFAGKHFSRQ